MSNTPITQMSPVRGDQTQKIIQACKYSDLRMIQATQKSKWFYKIQL
jgi:hypothetical protein